MGQVIQYPSGIDSTESQKFTSTAGQTVFPITSYVPMNIKVFIDGILTSFGWTYSAGVVTFSVGRTAGEEIIITN